MIDEIISQVAQSPWALPVMGLVVVIDSVGLTRWKWMRHHSIQVGFAWARRRLDQRTAVALFVARFIPFARIAVSLTAGASRVSAARFALVAAIAATLWAAYQALVGAAIAAILPGGPVVAVIVSVVVAIALGLGLDALISRITRRSRQDAEALVENVADR
ncbi:VTT domain-containing protein [Microbacterium sp. X-17]|uniref:VTT domain-containing protein n=1 Tax=Microbacterium sp. X-17 TaxID=3144404 RepID=UPI0031F54CB7